MSEEPAPPQTVPEKAMQEKADPETLTIRGRPTRAIRFRRSLVVSASAVLILFIVSVTWFALKPRVFRSAAPADEVEQPAKPSTDALSRAPTSYADVPKLGPPLPGDLGRPILDRQRQLEAMDGVSAPFRPSGDRQEAVTQEQDHRAAALQSARESSLMFQTGEPRAIEPMGQTEPGISTSAETARPSLEPDWDPNAQEHKAAFVASIDKRSDVNPHRRTAPTTPYMLSAGSVIAGSLITGLRSDLPGLVTAQITQNVYDSATGTILLIPQGARLIGTYDSVVAFGQQRALVVWQRILFPDTSSIRLENESAADASGYAGLEDKVDFHTWRLLKGVMLSTLLGVSSELVLAEQSDLIQAIRLSTQTNVSRAGDQITQRNLQVQPSITIRPGAIVRLIVHRDLILEPWKG